MAWAQRPRGLIKMEGSTGAFRVENVSWKYRNNTETSSIPYTVLP